MEKAELTETKNGDATTEDVESNEISREETLTGKIDMKNSRAFKGDDSDGKVDWNLRNALAAAFLAMLYTGSQIILYFVGGGLDFIAADIGNTESSGWLPVANTLAIAALAPFCGYLQDLFGKRYIAMTGALLICVGIILIATAKSFGPAVTGMALSGAGAAIGELTGLAGLAECVPVKFRGYSLAVVTAFVFPFTPYLLYTELLQRDTKLGWRWTAWISLIYNGITGLGLLFTYFPNHHTRADGLSRRAILAKIDYIGGLLSIIGLTLTLVALQAGGYSHPWTSAYVLCCLLIGIALLVAWLVWEIKFAKNGMIPLELFRGQRVVGVAYAMAFVGGMNFYSILNFYPLLFKAVYIHDPVGVGLRSLPSGIATTAGAIVFNSLLSTFSNHSREVIIVGLIIMTAFGGTVSTATPENPVRTVILSTLTSFGVGAAIVPTATVAMLATPDALITTAAALSLSVRAVGGAIGYSIYYNIFVNKLSGFLPIQVGTYAATAGLPLASLEKFVITYLTTPEDIMTVEGVTPAVVDAAALGSRWAYSLALRYVWWTSIAFGSCAIVICCFLPSTKKYQTNRVAVAF
ncbi:MFS general substrate transporter [Eremomyces bilateralis CBS 781.70]|uniref:MFS general substrate transporter n=1 Tax=Eremomyces bilateralis CBS 781.70 TaxID=1392243 RepID=A0A6G1G9I4_9PEZI|nr:MFS general substrate transporter [Eremomyces bilateralis CBS 781.70]KAF1814529.1 MFS general substrate transporter [Eremomyces bilateralis CBS 781.70]